MLNQSKSLENQFLVSMPQMDDPNFYRSVVLICKHGVNGAIGLIINQVSDQSFGDVCQQLDIPYHNQSEITVPIFNGGPMEPELGLILHGTDHRQWESSLNISENLQLTSSKDILAEMAVGNGPKQTLFVLGFSSWGPDQLEQEIKDNIWFTTPADQNILFSHHAETKWNMVANLLGVEMSQFSQQVGHA